MEERKIRVGGGRGGTEGRRAGRERSRRVGGMEAKKDV